MALKPNASSSEGSRPEPGKSTFVFLLILAGIIISGALALLYIIPYYGFSNIHPKLPAVMGVLMGAAGGTVLVVICLLAAAALLGRDLPFSRKLRSLTIKVMLPVLVFLGRLIGMPREKVQHAFVAVNNQLVMAHCKNGRPPKRILLLMPHCLQYNDCKVKVTNQVENCKRCGKCPIKDLLELSEKYGVDLAVATGGTIARRIVVETRPDLIIAVACERDLTSGIQDTTPLPVYGIFNERPFGPCFNTRVSIDRMDAILREVVSLGKSS
jgi:hypothetical protein